MINRMHIIAENIQAKVRHEARIEMIETYSELLRKSNGQDIDICLEAFMQIACLDNLLNELHDLLGLRLYDNINQPFLFHDHKGDTLLGLAAYKGHYELVSYLVEVEMANVNAQDVHGNTALHQVVYGDYYPFQNQDESIDHDKIAKYLVKHGADLSIENDKGETPYALSNLNGPLAIERKFGKRFITNTGSAAFYADRVRPVFEKALAQVNQHDNNSIISANGKREPKPFKQFCLDRAVKKYIENGQGSFGYGYVEDLYKALNELSEPEWNHMRLIISSQTPAALPPKFVAISDQLPGIYKKSAKVGVVVALLAYYDTQNILTAVSAGAVSAGLAWSYITENAYTKKADEKAEKEERFSDMQRQDRFFKMHDNSRMQLQAPSGQNEPKLDPAIAYRK